METWRRSVKAVAVILRCRVAGRRQAKLPRMNVYYEGDSANVSYMIENLMHGYDKRLRPNYKGTIDARSRFRITLWWCEVCFVVLYNYRRGFQNGVFPRQVLSFSTWSRRCERDNIDSLLPNLLPLRQTVRARACIKLMGIHPCGPRRYGRAGPRENFPSQVRLYAKFDRSLSYRVDIRREGGGWRLQFSRCR